MSNIFYSLLYTSIINHNSFLSRDQELRKKYFKKYFRVNKRKTTVSDSTLIRNLSNNIHHDELEEINFKIVKQMRDSCIEPVLKRRCLILDGTGVGKFLSETALIPSKTNIVLGTCEIEKKGKEPIGAKLMISKIRDRFDKDSFDLLIYDGLGFSKELFNDCNELLGAKLLIKTREDLNVIKEVETLLNNEALKVYTESGFDSERFIQYDIAYANQMSSPTIDFPLKLQ